MMNKKEKDVVGELRMQLRLAQSLHWTPAIPPDLQPPKPGIGGTALVKGFLFNHYGDSWRVQPACTSSAFHSFGRDDKTTTQNPCKLYSSRLLALMGCRNSVEAFAAKMLANIDAAIEVEAAKGAAHDAE